MWNDKEEKNDKVSRYVLKTPCLHTTPDSKNHPPGRKWNVVVASFCIQCIPRGAVFFHINSFILLGLCFFLNVENVCKLISKKRFSSSGCFCLVEFAYSYSGVENFTRWFSLVSHLGHLCEVCTEAVHSAAIWKRVTLQLWTCVKYVPKQSIP